MIGDTGACEGRAPRELAGEATSAGPLPAVTRTALSRVPDGQPMLRRGNPAGGAHRAFAVSRKHAAPARCPGGTPPGTGTRPRTAWQAAEPAGAHDTHGAAVGSLAARGDERRRGTSFRCGVSAHSARAAEASSRRDSRGAVPATERLISAGAGPHGGWRTRQAVVEGSAAGRFASAQDATVAVALTGPRMNAGRHVVGTSRFPVVALWRRCALAGG
mmetsp:Transcript_7955/g.27006  ORF Transcript_7955/g.27006 Transcript_7955/m.27006 type:complete len:217 (+) Transcript_7955:792-1442(+)